MGGIKIICVCYIFSFCVKVRLKAADLEDWNYQEKGPHIWMKLFKMCGGIEQSPVDIRSDNIIIKPDLSDFQFNDNYQKPLSDVLVENNGRGINFYLDKTEPLSLSRGGLMGKYDLFQFHFHWGFDSYEGSEHTFNGHQFPLELHLVHMLDDKELGTRNTIAVLAVLFELDKHDIDNPWIEDIVGAAFHRVTYKGDKYLLSYVPSIMDILPANTSNFFRYRGSLTTPSCQEIVIWSIFAEPQRFSKKQLSYFRTLMETDRSKNVKRPLATNFRPLQALNNRTISCRYKPTFQSNGSGNLFKFSFLFLMFTSGTVLSLFANPF